MQRHKSDQGSAVAEFVLISALVILLVMGVLQLAFALHVRITLIDCAGEGARVGAVIGAGPDAAIDRTRALIDSALHPSYGENISATTVHQNGLELVEVTVHSPLPLIGYFGPASQLTVTGHALMEGNS